MKAFSFFFFFYCKAFSFNAVKCVILVPCQESPLTQKPQGNLSHHLRVFMVLSLTLRSLTDLELVLCGLCYQMNFFPYVVKWKNKFLQKDHHFPLLAQPPRLKKKWTIWLEQQQHFENESTILVKVPSRHRILG